MQEAYCLCKLKHDIRVDSKVGLARREVEEILKTPVSDLPVLPALFRIYPFCRLDDKIVDRMTRLLYLGKIHGFITALRDLRDLVRLARNATYLREIYGVLLTRKTEIPEIVGTLRQGDGREERRLVEDEFLHISLDTQIYNQVLDGELCLTTLFLTPTQTILEYASEIIKLPPVTFTKQFTGLDEKIGRMEEGLKKGLGELFDHLSHGSKRMPWLGLFKEHIGDYVDWAFSDFRTWGLHFIHKHEGKADPWLARSALNFLGVREDGRVLDPFCGSGTFIADAPLLGVNAVGVDINPLSTLIARAKCSLVDIPLPDLRGTIVKIQNELSTNSFNAQLLEPVQARLEDGDKRKILGNEKAVLQILSIRERIDKLSDSSKIKDFLYTILSRSIIGLSGRRGSNIKVTEGFLGDAIDFYLYAYASQEVLRRLDVQARGKCTIFTSNALNVNSLLTSRIDGIVTSPPYFDALDYSSSSSLPIALLDLGDPGEDLQAGIIGSSKRTASDTDLLLYDLLPESGQLLIRELMRFGREKKARIVLDYLNDMSDCLASFFRILGDGGRIIYVVGKYHHWKIGNRNARFDGAQVLIDLGEQAGLALEDELTHNISKIEAGDRIREESIIIWRKGSETTGRNDMNKPRKILTFY